MTVLGLHAQCFLFKSFYKIIFIFILICIPRRIKKKTLQMFEHFHDLLVLLVGKIKFTVLHPWA